jgi:hypothetical protein
VRPVRLRNFPWLLAALCLPCAEAAAANLDFTVATSEPVVVTGVPRIAIDVGGLTRYATYATGSGTSALTFSYAVQAGDFDANGIAIAAPLDLNGGSITDVAGNPASGLTFTLPDTSALKVQTYTAAFATSPVTETNASAVSFAIAKAPTGASFTYSITSSGGAGNVTSSGTIGGSPHMVSGVDLSSLPLGTLTLSVTLSTAAGGTGAARTNSATPTLTASALDGLSAAVAYSTRRLQSAYTGPLLRVRRSSDNATQDIGATVGGNLDATALASFCGSASCFVSTWYDQSGNGRNAAQSTPGSQPRLVTSGVTELLGSRPAVRFDLSLNLVAPNALSRSDEFTASMTSVERVRAASYFAWGLNKTSAPTARVLAYIPQYDGYLYFDVAGFTVPNRIFKLWSVPIGTPAVVTFQNSAAAGTRGVYVNGSLFLSGNGYSDASDRLRLGEAYQGHFGEFILFPSSISSANRLAIERNQGSYYGITVP